MSDILFYFLKHFICFHIFHDFIFLVGVGVMRTKRRNTYVVNDPNNVNISSNASLSNSLAQSNTTNYNLSSTTPISSSMSDQPTHGSLKSVNSLDDNHRSTELPHPLRHSQYSFDQPSTTDSSASTTDLVC